MSKAWQHITLGDLVDITHGWAFKGKSFTEHQGDQPIVVSIGNFKYEGGFRFESTTLKGYSDNYPSDYELAAGDILLVMTCQTSGGEILGIPGRIPDDDRLYLHNQRMGKVINTQPEVVDYNFLYWLFLRPDFNRHLFVTATGTKILHTSPSRIKSYKFNLPPLPIQQRIADILGALDDKIELNRKMNQTLEAIAQALYKHWFVDFGPFQDGAFEDSALGPIPDGWNVEEIASLYNTSSGGTPSRKKEDLYFQGNISWLKTKELDDRFIFTTEEKITELGLEKSSAKLFPENTVIIAMYGATVGKLGILGCESATNQACCAIIEQEDCFPYFYAYLFLLRNRSAIVQKSSGSAQQNINQRIIRAERILMPPPAAMETFNRKVNPIFELIKRLQRESISLEQTRDYLLPKLLSGTIEVEAAEELVEDVR